MTITHPIIGYGAGKLFWKSRWMPWIAALGGILPDTGNIINLLATTLIANTQITLPQTFWRVLGVYSWWAHAILLPVLLSALLLIPRVRLSWFAPFWLGWLLHIPTDMISHIPANMPSYLWPFVNEKFGGLFDHEVYGFGASLLTETYAIFIVIVLIKNLSQKQSPVATERRGVFYCDFFSPSRKVMISSSEARTSTSTHPRPT